MRKWLLLPVLLLVILLVGVYAFIPNTVVLQSNITAEVNMHAFSRSILSENDWKKWWPGDVVSNPTGRSKYYFVFNGTRYAILGKHLSSHTISVMPDSGVTLLSQLLYVPGGADSLLISWKSASITSYQPLKRFSRYRTFKKLEKDWDFILRKMKQFYSNEEQIYDLPLRKELVKDSLLISKIIQTPGEPSIDTIYRLIASLQAYAVKKGAKQTGFPMLNVTPIVHAGETTVYRTQVALPLDKSLPAEGDIVDRRMLGKGKILAATVKGGPTAVSTAFEQMQQYIEDHQLVSPAIPFQSLITDRRIECDTANWITKVYWPVL